MVSFGSWLATEEENSIEMSQIVSNMVYLQYAPWHLEAIDQAE